MLALILAGASCTASALPSTRVSDPTRHRVVRVPRGLPCGHDPGLPHPVRRCVTRRVPGGLKPGEHSDLRRWLPPQGPAGARRRRAERRIPHTELAYLSTASYPAEAKSEARFSVIGTSEVEASPYPS